MRLAVARDPRIATGCPEGEIDDAGFTDVADGNVRDAAIHCLAHYGVVDGIGGSRYAPGSSCPSPMGPAAMTSIQLSPGDDAFVDDDGSVHEADINALAAAGITTGRSTDTYVPGAEVSRAKAASLFARTLDVAIWSAKGSKPPPVSRAFGGTSSDPAVSSGRRMRSPERR